ncbi:hypothetical protein ZWY2020_034135 [Hordeum vulgare]|nr:hypothetical protein ZWY2020_034135 [Hordeum vulgare]
MITRGGCTVYKLDVDAFQPDTGTGTDDHLKSRVRWLPHDGVAIRMASPDREQCDQFVCTGSKIFAFYKDTDAGRNTMVYDSATSQVAVCPPLLAPKVLAEFLTVGLDVYALETELNDGYNSVRSMEKLGPVPDVAGVNGADDVDGRHRCPAWTSVQDRVYNNRWKRHLAASLTYMGNAVFCLLETITRKGDDIFTEFRTRTLLRLATFRVEHQRNDEFRAANMRIMVY